MRLEDVSGSEHNVWARGNHFTPELSPRVIDRDRHQAEGATCRIRTDVKNAAWASAHGIRVMVGVVFVGVFARIDHAKFCEGLICRQEADLAGGVTRDREQKEGTAAGAFHLDAEALVDF